MVKKSNTFLLILALCVVIFTAIVVWLMQGKTIRTLNPATPPAPTLAPGAGTQELLQELQKTQDDGGEADLNQLQNEALDL